MRCRGGAALATAAILMAMSPMATAARAQDAPPATRTISGRIFTPAGVSDVRPVAGSWITLHRVSPGGAGPVDSTRSDASGNYQIHYTRASTDSAVFFVSASHDGITYFSSPLADGNVSGEAAQLVVYDTTSSIAVSVSGRHLILGSLDSTRRHPAVEIFDVVNDTTLTLVSSGDRPTWHTRLPAQAQDVRLTTGDISPDAVTVRDGVLSIFSPLAPGVKQIGVAYALPVGAFPMSMAIEDSLTMLELLVEDRLATVSGPTVEAADSVVAEGRNFVRYMGQDIPGGSVVTIDVPAPPSTPRALYYTAIVVVLGLLMLLSLGRSLRGRQRAPLGVTGGGVRGDADDLAGRIAALDAAFQRRRNPTEEERQEYLRQRGGLKVMLTNALIQDDQQR